MLKTIEDNNLEHIIVNNKMQSHIDFLSEQTNILHDELKKFIINTNYNESKSIDLDQKLFRFKAHLDKRKFNKKRQHQINYSTALPLLHQNTFNPNVVCNPRHIFEIKLNRNSKSCSKINTKYQPYKKNILLPGNANKFFKTNNTFYIKQNKDSFHDSLFFKYSNESRNQQHYKGVIYDNYRNPIIRNREINFGVFNMINKGIIPKIADVTPAFIKGGCPITITHNKIKKEYEKNNVRDDLAEGFEISSSISEKFLYNNNQNI